MQKNHKIYYKIMLDILFYFIANTILIQFKLIFMSQPNSTFKINDEQTIGLIKKDIPIAPQRQKIAQRQRLGDTILMYLKNAFWVIVGALVIYFSNFFHHLFRSPKINPLFFQISMCGYTMIILLIIYTSFILPLVFKINSVEEYNPKLIPIGAVIGLVSVVSLIIAIWPVWGFSSLLIFIALWKGFFSISVFLPSGQIGNIFFIGINVGTVLSFYIIEHEGYFH